MFPNVFPIWNVGFNVATSPRLPRARAIYLETVFHFPHFTYSHTRLDQDDVAYAKAKLPQTTYYLLLTTYYLLLTTYYLLLTTFYLLLTTNY